MSFDVYISVEDACKLGQISINEKSPHTNQLESTVAQPSVRIGSVFACGVL